ncbi:MAG TPA: type II secretion system protein GspC [Candidatus Nitrosopolaris sp.]|nr:type II secretion system protein GspC [Candidatus Nitrosopolaris sp.]
MVMVVVRRHRLAIELGLLALVASLAALGASAVLRLAFDEVPASDEALPPAAAAAPVGALDDYAVITARDLFNPAPATAEAASGAPITGGSLHLWGVALQGREARAVIEDAATHHQDLYRVGDVVGGARVAAIDWDRVTLARAGREETLELAPTQAAGSGDAPPGDAEAPSTVATDHPVRDDRIRRTSENAFVVDRRELDGAADNMSALLTQASAIAELRDGRPAGFRLFQIRADSLFTKLGLKDGDVVQRVNGRAIADPAALLAFLARLKTEPRVALDIVRGDAPRTLVYELR